VKTWPRRDGGGTGVMNSQTLYLREAAACQRAAEGAGDPALAKQLWQEQAMWLGLARLSAAIETLVASAPTIGGDPDAAWPAARRARRRPEQL